MVEQLNLSDEEIDPPKLLNKVSAVSGMTDEAEDWGDGYGDESDDCEIIDTTEKKVPC